MKDFAPDTFTEIDVLNALDRAGKKYKNGSRYILAQCPTHEDSHPSVQIYTDDWFVNCHAGCGRYHITKAYPDLRNQQGVFGQKRQLSGVSNQQQPVYQGRNIRGDKEVTEHNYIPQDMMNYWKTLPEIPRDHNFKGIDLTVLDSLGWRWDAPKQSYFIPYFSRSKTTIPFAQWRHLTGDRRFTFLKDAKPTMYGTWNLQPGDTFFLVEGASDAAVLDFCAVPWVAAPSAASGALVKQMAGWCSENDVTLVYAGDNDDAGHKLREALDEVTSYRVKQPPKKYKDWGDFFVAEGLEAVTAYCDEELNPTLLDPNVPDTINEIFPGAKALEVVDDSQKQQELLY